QPPLPTARAEQPFDESSGGARGASCERGAAVELEDDVSRGTISLVAHAVRFAGGEEDHVVRGCMPADRLERSLEYDDRDVVRVHMRVVAAAGLEDGDVRVELAQV